MQPYVPHFKNQCKVFIHPTSEAIVTHRHTFRAPFGLLGLFLNANFKLPAQRLATKLILCIQYVWMILHNYFKIRNWLSRGLVDENAFVKNKPRSAKSVISMFFLSFAMATYTL